MLLSLHALLQRMRRVKPCERARTKYTATSFLRSWLISEKSQHAAMTECMKVSKCKAPLYPEVYIFVAEQIVQLTVAHDNDESEDEGYDKKHPCRSERCVRVEVVWIASASLE